jgi:omega-amidase
LKTTIIQAPLFWENIEENLNYFENQIQELPETDLVVLPEMFTTGFSMDVSKTDDGEKTVTWMKKMAKNNQFAICGSIKIKENNLFYNRLYFITPNQEVSFYNKRHLFTLANEDKVYTRGTEKVIVNYKNWKICLQICYDLRFPVFARNVENYDLLIYVANWPIPRINAWDALLKARAIENMCYTIGVNRTGTDANEISYNGHSQVVDYLGNYCITPYEETTHKTTIINQQEMLETRKKLNFLNDKDTFVIEN